MIKSRTTIKTEEIPVNTITLLQLPTICIIKKEEEEEETPPEHLSRCRNLQNHRRMGKVQ